MPIDDQRYKNEAAEIADAVADTRIQEFSKLDDDKLRAHIIRLKKADYDLKLTGLDVKVIDSILAEYEKELRLQIAPDGAESGDLIRQVILIFDDQRFKDFTTALEKVEKKRDVASISELCLALLRERK